MTSRTAAARYARALLDVATTESVDLETIARELDEFVAFLGQQPALERVLLNPAIPASRKRTSMEEIVRLSGFTPVVSKLLILLADGDRLNLLHDITSTFHDLLAQRRNIIRAEITSAEPLSSEKMGAIEKKLTAMTGKRVAMTTKVDSGIIGGVVARVGSTVYDASVATQLKKMRERLTT